ncbi:type III pantothenate kinase [Flavobacteriales bacterium]|nr:type III pantothenate kinase [Flavobacteriales bacterium]
MKLIIDIGNSAVKVALFEDKWLLRTAELTSCSINNITNFLSQEIVFKTILSSVKNIDKQTLEVITHYKAIVLDEKTPLPIKINYETPDTLGKDRIAGVVAASCLYKDKNVLVLDFGSCLTIDVINKEKEYIGGRISPGLIMRYNALHQFTDQLPLCKIKNTESFIGNDTTSSINSGVQQGMVAEVKEVIDTFKKENKDTIVILTGGDCFFFEKALKNSIFANPFLVMEGLNEILDYNE